MSKQVGGSGKQGDEGRGEKGREKEDGEQGSRRKIGVRKDRRGRTVCKRGEEKS